MQVEKLVWAGVVSAACAVGITSLVVYLPTPLAISSHIEGAASHMGEELNNDPSPVEICEHHLDEATLTECSKKVHQTTGLRSDLEQCENDAIVGDMPHEGDLDKTPLSAPPVEADFVSECTQVRHTFWVEHFAAARKREKDMGIWKEEARKKDKELLRSFGYGSADKSDPNCPVLHCVYGDFPTPSGSTENQKP